MNTNWANYWAKTRNGGVSLFIFRRGTVLGLVMFALLIVLPRAFKMIDKQGLPIWQFCLFMALGYLLGWFLWVANERTYHKFRRQESEKLEKSEHSEGSP